MAACGRDGQRPLADFLPTDIGEIDIVVGRLFEDLLQVHGGWFERELFVEESDGIGERADADDFDAVDHGGFICVVARHQHAAIAFLLREHGHAERAFDGSQTAIECKLAGDYVFLHAGGDHAVGGEEHAEGDWQIEGGAFLADVGGGEVDDSAVGGQLVAAVCDSGANAFEGFLHRGIRQADDLGGGEAACGDVDLDFAGDGLDSDEGDTLEPREHGGGFYAGME